MDNFFFFLTLWPDFIFHKFLTANGESELLAAPGYLHSSESETGNPTSFTKPGPLSSFFSHLGGTGGSENFKVKKL